MTTSTATARPVTPTTARTRLTYDEVQAIWKAYSTALAPLLTALDAPEAAADHPAVWTQIDQFTNEFFDSLGFTVSGLPQSLIRIGTPVVGVLQSVFRHGQTSFPSTRNVPAWPGVVNPRTPRTVVAARERLFSARQDVAGRMAGLLLDRLVAVNVDALPDGSVTYTEARSTLHTLIASATAALSVTDAETNRRLLAVADSVTNQTPSFIAGALLRHPCCPVSFMEWVVNQPATSVSRDLLLLVAGHPGCAPGTAAFAALRAAQ